MATKIRNRKVDGQLLKATLHYMLHNNGYNSSIEWIAHCSLGNFPITEESKSFEGYPRKLKEGTKIEVEIITNYGWDPYDNQIKGLDYYNAARIIKYPDMKTKVKPKKKVTKVDAKIIPLPSQILGHNYVYHYNEFEKKWYCISRDSYLNYWSKNIKNDKRAWVSGSSIEDAAGKMIKAKK